MEIKYKKTISFITFIFFVFVLLSFFSIPIDSIDKRLESISSHLLDRKVSIHGPIRLKLSLEPTLEFAGISVSNPDGWEMNNHFLSVKKGSGQINLFSLITGNIQVKNIEFDGVDLQLITKADFSSNYTFKVFEKTSAHNASKHELSSIEHISLKNINVHYFDELSETNYHIVIDEAHGKSRLDSLLSLRVKGSISKQDYTLNIKGDSIHKLLHEQLPWHLTDGQLLFSGSTLDVSGILTKKSDALQAALHLSVKGQELQALSSILAQEIPEVGPFSLDTSIYLSPGKVDFNHSVINVFKSSIRTDISLLFQKKRPLITGQINIPQLNPEFIITNKQSGPTLAKKKAAKKKPASPESLPWDYLKRFDTQINMNIGVISNEQYAFTNIKSSINIKNGDLKLPFSLTAMKTSIEGYLNLITQTKIPALELKTNFLPLDIKVWADAFSQDNTIDGKVGAINLSLKSTGHTLTDLFKFLRLDLIIGPSNVKINSNDLLTTKKFSLNINPEVPLSLSSSGVFMERPYQIESNIKVRENDLTNAEYPFTLNLTACDSTLSLNSIINNHQLKNTYLLNFSLKGKTLCGFIASIENILGKDQTFLLNGQAELNNSGWSVNMNRLYYGSLKTKAIIKQDLQTNKEPIILVELHSKLIDLNSIIQDSTKANKSITKSKSKSKQEKPSELNLSDIKKIVAEQLKTSTKLMKTDVIFSLIIDQLEVGDGIISDVKMETKVIDGKITHSPFQAKIARSFFKGNAYIDLTNDLPIFEIELGSDQFNLKQILHEFKINDTPEIKIKKIDLKLKFVGKTLIDLFKNGSYEAFIYNGKWKLKRSIGTPLNLDLDFSKIHFFRTPDKPTTITFKGHVNSEPLNGLFTADGLTTDKTTIATINANLNQTKFKMSGKEKNNRGYEFNIMLSGTRLDKLNAILGVDLPPFGPYSISAILILDVNKFTLHDLKINVGESHLKGQSVLIGKTDKNGNVIYPLTVDTQLHAKKIQLNDFNLKGWSAVAATFNDTKINPDTKQSGNTQKISNKKTDDYKVESLLSPEMAKKFKGTLAIDVEQVFSGSDNLGNGKMTAELKEGTYTLNDLKLNIPAGLINMQVSLKPEINKVDASLNIKAKNLDYGMLARRIKKNSALKGALNLDIKLTSTANSTRQLKENLNGHFRIGIIPEEYEAGTIDLWAVNILVAALPAMMKGEKSTVNCIIGDMKLEKGIMYPKVLLMDTTSLLAHGIGDINFKTDTLNLQLTPIPKSPHFFSLATPINVTGSFYDYKIGPDLGDVAKTVARIATSIITVPAQWLFSKNLEKKGEKTCSEAMDWIHNKQIMTERSGQ